MRRRGPSPKAIQRPRANGPALPASLLVTQRAFEVRRALGHLVAGLPPKFLIELVADRKSVVSGKSVSVRVDLGGRLTIKKKKTRQKKEYTTKNTKPEHRQK